MDTICNIFTSGAATCENITDGVHKMKWISISHRKKQIFCLFHAFNPFLEELYQNPLQFFSVIPYGIPLPHSNALQYYVKPEKRKVNDVIFPSGCGAHAINLDNKNRKVGISTGGTSVRWKNIFTAISRYPTGKHEIIKLWSKEFNTRKWGNISQKWNSPKQWQIFCYKSEKWKTKNPHKSTVKYQ